MGSIRAEYVDYGTPICNSVKVTYLKDEEMKKTEENSSALPGRAESVLLSKLSTCCLRR